MFIFPDSFMIWGALRQQKDVFSRLLCRLVRNASENCNCAELRSFRRGCVALPLSRESGKEEVYTTYFDFQALWMSVRNFEEIVRRG